jgi:hypothetical protein
MTGTRRIEAPAPQLWCICPTATHVTSRRHRAKL